ncbi:hypothetical protein PoB_003283400 [Plakobranchus ocellatus]|uniref:Uncharacterized protein n=1 Tax=Plakobranchus ocellatus TaxID=259542 RepID=A0AAV4AJB4_9GAST|nr:hypothetical protein PoB_003283400 [Plakobranchus ocellatus]
MVPPPNELRSIPGLILVLDQEIRRYIQNLCPAALKSSSTEAINIEHFLALCLCGSSKSCRLHKVLYLCHSWLCRYLRGAFRYTILSA